MIENTLNYIKKIGKHNINALAGFIPVKSTLQEQLMDLIKKSTR
jgi:hypothetical protein